MAKKAKKRLSWKGFFLSLVTSLAVLSVVFFLLIGLVVGAGAAYRFLFTDNPLTAEQLLWRLRATAEGAVGLAVFWTLFAGVRLLLDPDESPWRGRRQPHRSGPTMRGFFKTVLFAGLPFGGLLGLIEAESLGHFVSIVIVAGVPFGVILGVILSVVQWWTTRRAQPDGAGAEPRGRAKRTVVVHLPLSAAYRKCFDAAMAVFGPGAVRQDRDSPTITVRTGTSWKSWGEHITIELGADDAGATTASITSWPRVRTTIFDYGKNRQNVDRVADWLASEANDDRYRDWRQYLLTQFDREP